MKKIFITILLVSAAACSAAELVCPVLKYDHDRLYFGCGREDLVFRDAPFTVQVGKQLIYRGRIEFVDLGIAYSHQTGRVFDTIPIDSLRAEITIAEIDSSAHVVLGTTGFLPTSVPSGDAAPLHINSTEHTLKDHSASDTLDDPNVSFRRYPSHSDMRSDFDAGRIDGFFSFQAPPPLGEAGTVTRFPAPFLFALVPDISSNITRNSLLATSIYYRFDPQRLWVLFDGDSAIALNCFCPFDSSCVRPYPYDPDRGRQLGRRVRDEIESVRLSYDTPELRKTALYFSDILSRDPIHVRPGLEKRGGDCRLIAVPLSDTNQFAGVEYILDYLATDTANARPINQTIALASSYLRLARLAGTDSLRAEQFRKCERTLTEEIGAFPLFRPLIFLVSSRAVIDWSFTPDGELEWRNLKKLVFPAAEEEAP